MAAPQDQLQDPPKKYHSSRCGFLEFRATPEQKMRFCLPSFVKAPLRSQGLQVPERQISFHAPLIDPWQGLGRIAEVKALQNHLPFIQASTLQEFVILPQLVLKDGGIGWNWYVNGWKRGCISSIKGGKAQKIVPGLRYAQVLSQSQRPN